MLFKIDLNKDIFEINPELKAVEEFARLTPRQMTYVVLATDYKTPFRKLPIEQRKYYAALEAGYKLEKDGKRLDNNARNLVNGNTGSVEAAIKKYMILQRDEDYETLLSVSNLIAQIRDFNNKPDKTKDELKAAVEMNVSKLDKLIETKKKIEDILDMREDPVMPNTDNESDSMVEDDNLSLLAQVNMGKINLD